MTTVVRARDLIALILTCILSSACSSGESDDVESGDNAFSLNPFAGKSDKDGKDGKSASANGAAQTTASCAALSDDIGVSNGFTGKYDDWSVDLTVSPHYQATLALGSALGATVKSKVSGTERKLNGAGASGPRLTFAVIPNTSDSPKTYRISFRDLDPSGPHGWRTPGVPDVSVEVACHHIADASKGERSGRNQRSSCVTNEPCLTDASQPGYEQLPPVQATCDRSKYPNLADPQAGGADIGSCPNR